MSTKGQHLDVTVLGREYRFACPPEEREDLQAAVQLVDERMQKAANSTRNMTAERAAVMTAVNIAYEFLNAGKKLPAGFDSADVKRKMEHMDARLDDILNPQMETVL